ncbi:MAG: DUF6252 family protein, partial [Cryomorphaceae bacterium]
MKHSLITLIFASASLFLIVACNSDDEIIAPPTPTFLVSGQTIDPVTGETSPWATNSVTAQLDSLGFFIKAVRGSDTLSIAIDGIDTLMYPITNSSNLSSFNYYQTVPTTGFGFYSFKADGSGGGILNITNHDTINQTFSGDLSVQFFNPINNSDFIDLNNVTLTNIPYTVIAPDTGGETGGGGPDDGGPLVGTMSYTINGTEYTITAATGVNSAGVLALSGANPPLGNPTLSISLSGLVEPGIYTFDNAINASATVLQGVSQ